MMADFDGFYEGRVVEAELEAIRLRKDDPNRVMFWLWPPFGPTEERERELTAPKPLSPLHQLHSAGLQNSSSMAYYQAAMMQNALAQTAYSMQRQGYYANIFGLGRWF
jgi:hypothetical protein